MIWCMVRGALLMFAGGASVAASAPTWELFPGRKCWSNGHGAEPVGGGVGLLSGVHSVAECKSACAAEVTCDAIIFSGDNKCFRKRDVDVVRCGHDPFYDLYVAKGLTRLPFLPPPPTPPPPPPYNPWLRQERLACRLSAADQAAEVEDGRRLGGIRTLTSCQDACVPTPAVSATTRSTCSCVMNCSHRGLSWWGCSRTGRGGKGGGTQSKSS